MILREAGHERRLDLGNLAPDARGDVLLGEGTFDPPTTPLDADGQGAPYATYGFAAQIAEVEVDVALGRVVVHRIVAAPKSGSFASRASATVDDRPTSLPRFENFASASHISRGVAYRPFGRIASILSST